jgi:UDP-N-acetylmuramate dehydrogenase
VFINNKDCAAGERIERLGLKGLSIGGAEVSKLHANYIINTGKATTEDIHNLIKKIQKISLEKEGVALSTEVKIVNE